MFRADEGLAWLEMHETLRPEDAVIAVTPCTEQFLVIETKGKLDMGTTVEEVRSWAEVLKESPHKRPIWLERVQTCRDKAMTPRQTELSKRACTPIQRKVMVMREQYAVEEVARAFDKTAAEIDRIEAEGWLKLGSYHLITQPSATDEFMDPPRGGDTLAMMKEPAQTEEGCPRGGIENSRISDRQLLSDARRV